MGTHLVGTHLVGTHLVGTLLMSTLLVGSIVPVAFAQQSGGVFEDPFAGVEEMVVVGTGASALLAESNTSAIAFDGGELEALGIDDVGDIAAYVPNLEIRTANATNASFFVRGVGLQDFGANASSAVPIFQDGVVRNPSATQLVGLFDIQSLAVQKGPQGSGNFRNASAGSFVISTRRPEPEFSASGRVTLSRIASVDARDANRYDFETAVTAPVYSDIVSVRLSARYRHENPWFENGCANRLPFDQRAVRTTGGDASLRAAQICGENVTRLQASSPPAPGNGISEVTPFLSKYLGEIDDFGFRGQIRIQPPDSGMDWVFRLELSRLNRDSTLGQIFGANTSGVIGVPDRRDYRDPDITNRLDEWIEYVRAITPGNLNPRQARDLALPFLAKELYKDPLDQKPYRGDFDRPGRLILETWVATTTGNIEIDDALLQINVGYVDYRLSEGRDTDLTPNIAFPSVGNNQAWEVYGATDLSQDTLMNLPLAWKTGFYTMLQKVEAHQVQTVLNSVNTNRFYEQIYSFGVFAEGEYELFEGLTIGAGVRYNWERKDFQVVEDNLRRGGFGGGGFTSRSESENQRTWDAFTGFGKVQYAFTEDLAVWFKYSRGFKAGHFNQSRPRDAKDPRTGFADPEKIDAFEWGLDATLWEGRLSGALQFFFYNYKNYQVFRLTTTGGGVFRTIESARLARNYGGDLEIGLSPLEGFVPELFEGLRIKVNAGWLESEYLEFATLESRNFGNVQIGVPIDFSGNPLISAPNLQVTGTITWPLVTDTLGTITPQYDFSWSDDTPFDPNRGRGELNIFGESVLPPYLIGNRAYILHNVRLSWSPPGNSGLTVSGWCRNLEDRKLKTFAVDLSTFTGSQLLFVGEPRRCGADVRFEF